MRYFIIAGEASGDLHASNLMAALKREDAQADFCFLGGDLMQRQGGKQIRHYKDMAFMGIVPVILHIRTILKNKRDCEEAMLSYRPDVLILVDYPSFNLKMAEFAKKNMPGVKVFYYISPKLWAWKEYRLKSIKKYVDRVYSILPFEVEWYKQRGYDVEYVGNPCVDAVSAFTPHYVSRSAFLDSLHLVDKPVMALLAGSRLQEIRKSLPVMLEAASSFSADYQLVVAGAPSIDKSVYDALMEKYSVPVVFGETYELLSHADLAVVTSGTATLETALFRVPQVVIYKMSGGRLFHWFLQKLIKVRDISLVNLIIGKRLVEELVIEEVTVERVRAEITRLRSADYRSEVLRGYDLLIEELGKESVSDKAARQMVRRLRGE